MDRHRVAIIVPAYNESETIADVIFDVLPLGTVIVVDDGSADATDAVAEGAGAIVVRQTFNGGYDSALEAGFAEAAVAGFPFVVTMDADGQHSAADVASVIEALKAGNDFVVGVRNHKGRLAERLFGLVTLLRWGIRDPLCGLKGYRMSLYKSHGRFDSCRSTGTELLIFGLKNSKTFTQVPVFIKGRPGHSRFGSAVKANHKILRSILAVFWMRFS